MSWFERNLPWLLVALLLATTVAFVGTLGLAVVAVLGALLGGAGAGAVLGQIVLFVAALGLLGALDVAVAVALVVTLVRRASLPTSERWAARAERAERFVPPLRSAELSERLSPSLEERKQRLEQRYVEGELSEFEFERRMADLLDDATDEFNRDEGSPELDDEIPDLDDEIRAARGEDPEHRRSEGPDLEFGRDEERSRELDRE